MTAVEIFSSLEGECYLNSNSLISLYLQGLYCVHITQEQEEMRRPHSPGRVGAGAGGGHGGPAR